MSRPTTPTALPGAGIVYNRRPYQELPQAAMEDLLKIPLLMTLVAALSIGAIYLISLLFKDGDDD